MNDLHHGGILFRVRVCFCLFAVFIVSNYNGADQLQQGLRIPLHILLVKDSLIPLFLRDKLRPDVCRFNALFDLRIGNQGLYNCLADGCILDYN